MRGELTAVPDDAAPGVAERNPALVYLARLSPGSQRTMRAALDKLAVLASDGRVTAAEHFPWHLLRYQHTGALRARLLAPGPDGRTLGPASVNKHLAALRGVLRESWRLGLVGADDHQRAVDLPPARGKSMPAGRSLSPEEVRALFAACAADAGTAGARDAALLAVLYGSGLRRAEAVALTAADHDPEEGALRVRQGKGRKERRVYLADGAHAALHAWLRHRGDWAGPLFTPVDRKGRAVRRALTGQAVLYVLRRRAEQAGVPPFSPHDLRRTFVGDLLDAGADLVTVQQLAGHANPATTSRYDRRGERARQEAARRLHVPYGGVGEGSENETTT